MTNIEFYEAIMNMDTVSDEMKEKATALHEKEVKAAEKAKERAAKKAAEGDDLRARVEAVLTDSPQTVNDILAALGDETLTPAKVVARLTQLRKFEKVTKEEVRIDGRSLVAYKLAAPAEEAEVTE